MVEQVKAAGNLNNINKTKYLEYHIFLYFRFLTVYFFLINLLNETNHLLFSNFINFLNNNSSLLWFNIMKQKNN